jgi:hypothetical protein
MLPLRRHRREVPIELFGWDWAGHLRPLGNPGPCLRALLGPLRSPVQQGNNNNGDNSHHHHHHRHDGNNDSHNNSSNSSNSNKYKNNNDRLLLGRNDKLAPPIRKRNDEPVPLLLGRDQEPVPLLMMTGPLLLGRKTWAACLVKVHPPFPGEKPEALPLLVLRTDITAEDASHHFTL